MNTSGHFKYIFAGLAALLFLALITVWWGYGHLTELVQHQLQIYAGKDLTIGKVNVQWNKVELTNVQLARNGSAPFQRRLAIDRLVLRPRFTSLFGHRLELDAISISKPYLLLEIAPDGSPVPFTSRQTAPETKSTAARPITIRALHITDGVIDILDRHVVSRGGVGASNPREGYHHLKFDGINLDLGSIDIPLENRSTNVQLAIKNHTGGDLTLQGSLTPKSLDSDLKLAVSNLNIIDYRPYFLKKGDLDVTSGLLTVQSVISVKKRQLQAPGEITLRRLAFSHAGTKGFWMGVTAGALVNCMANNNGELKVRFSVNGNLDNPRFVIRQSLMEQLAAGLSSKLGLTGAASVGKSLFNAGGSGVKGLLKAFQR